MRSSRWLILAAFIFVVAFVGLTYIRQKQFLARNVVVPPRPLESGID